MSRYQLTKTIAMVGMMGAGKTAVGGLVAKLLDVPFLDSDHEIELAANLSVAEVFEQFGEHFFREKESLILRRLMSGPPCVLSTGGGAYLQDKNRDIIARYGVAVWLKADVELLWSRVKSKDTRPLLNVPDPHARLLELDAQRRPFYEQAEIIVSAGPKLSAQEMAEKVVVALENSDDRIVRKVA